METIRIASFSMSIVSPAWRLDEEVTGIVVCDAVIAALSFVRETSVVWMSYMIKQTFRVPTGAVMNVWETGPQVPAAVPPMAWSPQSQFERTMFASALAAL